MANRVMDMGMDSALSRKMDSKYDVETEKEVINWFNAVTGENVALGKNNVQAALKNGQLLVKLINTIYAKSTNLPPAAKARKFPFKINTMNAPFKQMENIEVFLKAIDSYGVPSTGSFQTVDLYENRNMASVLNTLSLLGTECQRHGFQGPTCGQKPVTENKREFTEEQLNASKGIIGLQAGSNKGASQSGMSAGGPRHIADIKVAEMSKEGQNVIGLQAGSNKGASQSGMSAGGPRHIADIKVGEMSKDGKGVIGLQAGTNKGASQSGMSFGATRHITDSR